MNRIRREVLNGLFVIVLSTLLSAAIAALQVKFDVQLWVWIVMALATATTGYVIFEFAIGFMTSTEEREKEWLKRVGNPARLELGLATGTETTTMLGEILRAMRPGSDLTIMLYVSPEGGRETAVSDEARGRVFGAAMDLLRRGAIREYKRIICFDPDVFATNHELNSGILRVGEGPGTINRVIGEHCREMMETKGCSLYVAPAVVRHNVGLIGADKVSMSVETLDQGAGTRAVAGILFFSDPPNGEIVEQFRQLERATERRMVAVRRIVFSEDESPTVAARLGTR